MSANVHPFLFLDCRHSTTSCLPLPLVPPRHDVSCPGAVRPHDPSSWSLFRVLLYLVTAKRKIAVVFIQPWCTLVSFTPLIPQSRAENRPRPFTSETGDLQVDRRTIPRGVWSCCSVPPSVAWWLSFLFRLRAHLPAGDCFLPQVLLETQHSV